MVVESIRKLFELIGTTPPVSDALEQIGEGRAHVLSGLVDAAKPAVVAALGVNSPGPLCLVVPDIRRQEAYYSDLQAFVERSLPGVEVMFFPEIEELEDEQVVTDPGTVAERLLLLTRLSAGNLRQNGIIVATHRGFFQKLARLDQIASGMRTLKTGDPVSMEELMGCLVAGGYEAVTRAGLHGQIARRGGILDVFPYNAVNPVRLEFDGDYIESIREFDVDTQISAREIRETHLLSVLSDAPGQAVATLLDYLPEGTLLVVDEVGEIDFEGQVRIAERKIRGPVFLSGQPLISAALGVGGEDEHFEASAHGDPVEEGVHHFFGHDFQAEGAGDIVVQERRRAVFLEQFRQWCGEGWTIHLFGNNEGELRRLSEILEEAGVFRIPDSKFQIPNNDPESENENQKSTHSGKGWVNVHFEVASVLHGFVFPAGRQVVLTDSEIFGRYQTVRRLRREERLTKLRAHSSALDFSELQEGDTVVHLQHGIGLYGGLQKMPVDGREEEVLVVIFAENARLFVPLEQAYLVTKYVGVGRRSPALDVLGGTRWERARTSAQRSVMDYAAQLLKIHAQRETDRGHAFGTDGKWMREFEDSFLYEETPDQERAIIETKRDMESLRPMDRLVCGDVGFGKTEVAIRAIFKCVMEGKQAALLAPTTVLAQQHYRTLVERFADYPLRVEVLNRYRSARQQKETLAALVGGQADVVVGTHRLISGDVKFKDLGLVVVDEEQRFGVRQKEKFKERFRLVDMMTLSATPIPRTLYLSLSGARDMSLIETPPRNRVPVETVVAAYDERLIRSAIERELARNGQVYFLHNRVESILKVRDRIKELVPRAKVDVGHGQMDEEELETVMAHFIGGRSDVLISTTIIESGLDIPNANTMIIDRADRFGLADLYQLRGRVGRSDHKAYAYLLLPRHLMLQQNARKRVSAIKQYSQLGAGFKIAMRDLEIRGAGNILGTEQSGHISAIGFDLYCHLLKATIAQLKGERAPLRREVSVRLDFLSTTEYEMPDSKFQIPKEGASCQEQGKHHGAGEGNSDGAPREPAWIPRRYMDQTAERVAAYRRLAEASNREELEVLRVQWRDRYGKMPPAMDLLLLLTEVKILSSQKGLVELEVKEGKVVAKKRSDFVMVGGRFPRLTGEKAKDKLLELIKLLESF
ncbi:MAG: transcription-repair coupling factor [Verrucomicrobiae bacterium]|nr:transcription-repair coupling factor [Verrucomicrobiae bacterium]